MKANNSKTNMKTKENKQPDIKIFVSHRIDMDAETIDNPLYVNVRCGAVFDKRENVDMLGDDTGDNISEKRDMYNELTVQYWAWKNVEADYYGLCDERKYFSLSEKQNKYNNKVLYEEYLTQEIIKKYELDNNKLVDKLLDENDFVIMQPIDIRTLTTPKGYAKNIMEYIEHHDNILCKQKHIDILLLYIKNNYQEIYFHALKYINSYYFINSNIFIMEKKLFQEYNKFLFDILFHLDKNLKKEQKYYSETMMKSINFMGILLLGIFNQYYCSKRQVSKSIKMVYFKNIEKQKEVFPFSNDNNIAISIRISNHFAPYFAVLLQSIIDYANEKNNYDIIVLERSVTKENKQIIASMVENKNNISVRYINPEYLLNNIDLYISLDRLAREAYYTLITPYMLKNYDKILALDSDLILQGDVAEIYNHNVDNYLAASTKEIVWMGYLNIDKSLYKYCKEILHLDNPFEYVNTGVVVLNLKKIREEFKLNYIIDKARKNKYRCLEQDMINMLFNGQIKFINCKYNHYTNNNAIIANMLNNAPFAYNKLYEKINNTPYVIHFVGSPKPWSDTNIPFANKWWEIARKTPFYEMILQRMMQEQSGHVSFATLDHFSRIMFPFKWLKKVHKIGYIRQIADRLLPHGTKRRKIVKKMIFR